MKSQYYIGMMSGTSLDGVDLALVDFSSSPRIVNTHFVPMPVSLKAQLSEIVKKGQVSLQLLGEIDHRLALLYAESVNELLAQNALSPSHILAIGCHGQTIWHSPQGEFPFTTQIGDMSLLAVKTGIPVVGDFRRKDIAYGGQGAPLVPAFHQAILRKTDEIIAVLNIGGISNVSLLVPELETIGYDIGAGNTLMDIWIEQHLQQAYDKDGQWAKSGQINSNLLTLLLDEPYLKQPAPKSTGRELFNTEWILQKLAKLPPLAAEDVQATLLEFTVQSIAQDLSKLDNPLNYPKRLLVCGGGARNAYLLERLQNACVGWEVSTTDKYGFDADYMEAAAFAWLAYCYLNHLPSNLPSVTGASQAVSLGALFIP